LCTLPIRCKSKCSSSLFISMTWTVLAIPTAGSWRPSHQELDGVNSVNTACSWRDSHVVFDCLPQITSHPRDDLQSIPTVCGIMANQSRSTLQRSVYIYHIPSSCRNQ
jgi:hypothetical protein